MSNKNKMPLEDVDVIDWDEAMQQCGDDEEFLRELLGDLRDETDSQMARMEEIVKDPSGEGEHFMAFVRAAHVIKGAASNLMCEQLRTTAMGLESAAQAAFGGEHERSVVLEGVIKKLEGLKVAVKNYHDYLKEIGV